MIFKRGSGCYGINGADTVSYDAALLSQAVGKPVRVQLSRKDEMAWENYGFAFVIDQRVGARRRRARSSPGTTKAWSPTLGGRPGYEQPGQRRSPVMLAGFEPAPFTPRSPAPEPGGAFNNNSNAVPSYVTGCVGGRCGGTGTVASERVLSHTRAVAVLHRTAALAGAAAEHLRARIVHGRDRGAREGRSGRVSPASPERSRG